MAWTNKQKAAAASACRAAGIGDEQRRMILSGPSFNQRAIHEGRPTSTSPRLTNEDYESFMAIVERQTPGNKIATGGPLRRGYEEGHFAAKDPDHRLRWKAERIANSLVLSPRKDDPGRGCLEPDGVGLRGWIHRVTRGAADSLEACDRRQLIGVIDSLKNYARQHGVLLND